MGKQMYGVKPTIKALKNKGLFRKRLIALNKAEAKKSNSAVGRKIRSKLIKMLGSVENYKKKKTKKKAK